MLLCNDVDLLRWEPNVFRDASAAAQVLLGGTGALSGTTFTASSGSFIDARVAPGNALSVSGGVVATLAIIDVTSATVLGVSVMHGDLYSTGGSANTVPPKAGSGLTFSVATFSPQIKEISDGLFQAAGIMPGTDDETKVTILNSEALRRPCVLGTLMLVYRALATAAPVDTKFSNTTGGADPANQKTWNDRADLYMRLYLRATRAVRVEVDLDGDGVVDEKREMDVVRWVRV
jgi:hypothetical protein